MEAAPPRPPGPRGTLSRTGSLSRTLSTNLAMDSSSYSKNGPLPVFRLSGKVALITAGGGKIGQETARRFLREGASICLVDKSALALQNAIEVCKETLSTGQSVNSRILTIVGDATVDGEVENFVQKTVAAFGRLDCAFLDAGTDYPPRSIFDATEEDYTSVMRQNVKSAFLGVKYVATAMRKLGNGGSIIVASSLAGIRGSPGHILESSSKSALNGLAQTAAAELGQYAIRVNAIHPIGLANQMKKIADTPEELKDMKEAIPLGRFAQGDDVASVVAFLASEDSKFMTGGDLKVDGGVSG